MKRSVFSLPLYALIGLVLWGGMNCAAIAAPPTPPPVIPGPADVSRITPPEQPAAPSLDEGQSFAPTAPPPMTKPPAAAKSIHFTLQKVEISGNTVFTESQLQAVYAPNMHKDITLDTVYAMADEITRRYRDAGYFLSLATVPNQQIHDGIVKIKVTEGYIGTIDSTGTKLDSRIVRAYSDRLLAKKPVKADDVEDFLLRVNDLPGYSFRGVLSSFGNAEEGAVKLTLETAEKSGVGSITFDNYSSRYLGPQEVSASYSTSFLPLQQTTFSGLNSLPDSDLYYGTIDHTIVIAPNLTLDINGGVTKAYPGYTLKDLDIKSQSISAGIGATYQLIRQREQNLSFKLAMDGRNVRSDYFGGELSHDDVRAIRMGANYDVADSWSGNNTASMTLSQGLSWLGASEKNDINLSRAGALPDFAKAELSLSRLQGVTEDWSVFAAASGQMASGTLYSSEEFGYGGQAFGRAYDASDITGDQGISGSAEVRYGRWASLSPVAVQPYVFSDSGVVWNTNKADGGRESGTSAGFGMRFSTKWQQTGNVGIAWPLTRDITAPIYGGEPQGPRVLLQVSQQF